jgi:hypothetical protein
MALLQLPNGEYMEVPDDATAEQVQAAADSAMSQSNEFSFGEMVSNIPESAVQFGKDIAQPFLHPIETAKSLGGLGVALVGKAAGMDNKYTAPADAVGGYLSERYGGLGKTKATLQQDPVGMLSDVAGVLTGGASMLPKASKAAQIAGNVGRIADPVNLAMAPVKAGAKAASRSGDMANRLTQSSAKFGTTYTIPQRRQFAETMLNEGILPNVKGYDKLRGKMIDLGGDIERMIGEATATGQKVPITRVLRGIPETVRQVGGPTLNAAADVSEVSKIAVQYLRDMLDRGITHLSAEDLQKLKTDTYDRVTFDIRNPAPTKAKEGAYKSIAREAKGAIEELAPGIKDVNAKYGELQQLRGPLERSVNRITNRDIVGIGVPMKAVAGEAMHGGAGAAAGVAQGILDAPVTKARLGQAMRRLETSAPFQPQNTARVLLRTIAANNERAQREAEEKLNAARR